jgi:hypothetical protein
MGPARSTPGQWLRTFFALSGLVGLLGCDHAVLSPDEALGPSFVRVGPGGTTLELHAKVRLLADGTVRVKVEAGCPEGLAVLEAFVTVSQAAAFGEAFIPADCTGRTQKHRLIVTAFEGSFGPGPAVVSGLLLAEDPTTFETEQDQDTETVELR